MYTSVDADSFWVDAYFTETALGSIREGDPAKVKLMGYSDIVRGHVEIATDALGGDFVITNETGSPAETTDVLTLTSDAIWSDEGIIVPAQPFGVAEDPKAGGSGWAGRLFWVVVVAAALAALAWFAGLF